MGTVPFSAQPGGEWEEGVVNGEIDTDTYDTPCLATSRHDDTP